MPITYTISREERLIKAYATGVIRADDVFTELPAAEAWLEDSTGSSDTGETPLTR